VANAIEHIVSERERKDRLRNLNMIIGVFFSEVGMHLIKKLSAYDPDIDKVRSALVISNSLAETDFVKAHETLRKQAPRLESQSVPLAELQEFLSHDKRFMLTPLENHRCSNTIRSRTSSMRFFYLSEELHARDILTGLPMLDYNYLSEDINRVNGLIITEWLTYMPHRKTHYPYFFLAFNADEPVR
jgi:hypothetical protein